MTAKSSLFHNLFGSKSRRSRKNRQNKRRMFVEGLENRIVLDHQGLAVAFIDMDGDHDFTAPDILVSEIVDMDHSGTVNAGDVINFGSLPTGITGTDSVGPTAINQGTISFGISPGTGNVYGGAVVSGGPYFEFQFLSPSDGRETFYLASGNWLSIADWYSPLAFDRILASGTLNPTGPFGDLPPLTYAESTAPSASANSAFIDVIVGGHTPRGIDNNADPELTVTNTTVTVNEGQTANNSGTVSDDDGDTVSLNASAGTVTNNNDGTWSWSQAADDGTAATEAGTTVTIDGDDGNGGTDDVSFTLIVNNLAPDADIAGPGSALIGESVTFTLGADDASSADQAAGFDFDIDWDGDGTVDETVSGLDGTTVNHTFTTGGATTVIVTATDKDSGESDPVSFQINVIQPVDVDVKPGNAQNKVNAKSQGLVTVALHTTNDFDAASVIGSSVQLAGVSADHFALEDVDNDGDLDLVLHFAVQDLLDALALDLDSGDEESVDVSLTGETNTGIDIFGSDTINFFFPGKGKGKK